MHQKYQIVCHEPNEFSSEEWFAIHEIYYDVNEEIIGWNACVEELSGENLFEIFDKLSNVDQLETSTNRDILKSSMFDNVDENGFLVPKPQELKYRIVTQWSDEDSVFVATVPTLDCSAHGKTRNEAIIEAKKSARLIMKFRGVNLPMSDIPVRIDEKNEIEVFVYDQQPDGLRVEKDLWEWYIDGDKNKTNIVTHKKSFANKVKDFFGVASK